MKGQDTKIVVVGMGFLATYVMPCYKKLLGDNISANMIGIKGSERGLKEKQAECPFPVIVGHIVETLKERRPDVIILAVKPHQISGVTENEIKEYFEFLRGQGEPLPQIISFAPDPMATYYYDALGTDVKAVNMLPNMISLVEGHDLSKVGVAFTAFDPRVEWDPAEKEDMNRFMDPVGTVVEVDADKAIQYLSLQVAGHLMFEFNYIAQDVMKENGYDFTLADTAQGYRSHIHTFFKDDVVNVLPTDTSKLPQRLLDFQALLLDAWYQGIMDLGKEEGIPEGPIDRNICGTMESYQMEAQLEPKETLVTNTKNHATPGGFLEMCLITFSKGGYAYAENALRAWMKGEELPGLKEELRKIGYTVTKAISDHGKTVSGVKQK